MRANIESHQTHTIDLLDRAHQQRDGGRVGAPVHRTVPIQQPLQHPQALHLQAQSQTAPIPA